MGQAARSAAQGAGVAIELESAASLAGFAREWRDLAARQEGSSYFQTPDWVLAWWETLAGRPRSRVATWRSSAGALEALVVLSRDRERLHRRVPLAVRVLANAGSGAGAADHCGWLVAPQRAAEVGAWLSEEIGGSALLVRSADADWASVALPAGARVVDQTACPRVELPLGAGPSRSFVRQLRRFTRRLAGAGVAFEWVAPGQVDEPLLAALFALHAEGRRASTFAAEQLAFHRRLVASAGQGRGPAAVVARRGAEVVGVLYGFWWRDTFAAYQSGWDRRFARDALGNVLVLHALEQAADHGARTFDFLRGTEPYKYRFGARDRWDRTWLVPRGVAGALLAARHRLRERRRSTQRAGRPAALPPAAG
jgi:CelD/BcsL family acetyltransferase involved in cellulose biosynthesis